MNTNYLKELLEDNSCDLENIVRNQTVQEFQSLGLPEDEAERQVEDFLLETVI